MNKLSKTRHAFEPGGTATTGPCALRQDFRYTSSKELNCRRGIVALSLLGIASMVPVILYQTGILRHLADPPVGNFHSDKVNATDEAYSYAGPDGPLSVIGHAANLALATTGTDDRSRRHPWLSLLATVVAGGQAAVAGKYLFYQMPKVDKAWCPYCITDAIAHMATVTLTLPEAQRALRRMWHSWH